MHTRYFRLKNPKCRPEEIEWIEMSGREFYCFVNSPEGQGRHFIDMDDVVLEASEGETRRYKSEKKGQSKDECHNANKARSGCVLTRQNPVDCHTAPVFLALVQQF